MRNRQAIIGERILGTRFADGAYRVSIAANAQQVRAAQRLRFEVFNIELGGGLADSYRTGLDEDEFDARCDHLLLEHMPSQTVVGTYRLLTGANASAAGGYYSAQEFDLSPFEPVRGELVELGRACIHRQHRNLATLGLLWKGIADYASGHSARYLIGCSSVSTLDSAVAAAMYRELVQRYLVAKPFRTVPLPEHACPLESSALQPPKVPKLLSAYLAIGARVCGPPAIDREFGTVDFLTFLDLHEVSSRVWALASSGGHPNENDQSGRNGS